MSAAGKPSVFARLFGLVIVAAMLGGLGYVAIQGFLEGREEAAIEAERSEPIKPPLRVTLPERGQPIVTVDEEAREAIGLQTLVPRTTPYQEQIRAFGTVLDLAELTTLHTNYVEAVSQLRTARAKVAASLPAYERARDLYSKNIGNLVQVQSSEAALIGDKAAVEAAESKVRTLKATALQEWGPVIGLALANGSGLVHRLIEREEFLLQITIPPGRSIDPPPTASVEIPGSNRRVELLAPKRSLRPRTKGRVSASEQHVQESAHDVRAKRHVQHVLEDLRRTHHDLHPQQLSDDVLPVRQCKLGCARVQPEVFLCLPYALQ